MACMEPDYRKIAETLVISDEAQHAGRLFRESCSLADSGHFDEAIELAESIANTNFRLQDTFKNEALTYVTARCAEAGEIDRALKISEKISDSYNSGALFWIALACDRYGQRERAFQIARSISNGDVQKDALGKLEVGMNT